MNPTASFFLSTILAMAGVVAADTHDHSKVIPGPKGGRVLEVGTQHAEFFVQPDKKAAIYFYDAEMKALVPGAQEIVLIAEAPSAKARLEFDKTAEGFISKSVIPEGASYRVVLQVRETAGAKPENFRIDYNSAMCGGCQRAEYACTCGH